MKIFGRTSIALACLFLAVLCVPRSRAVIFGLLRGESFAEDFMPLSYHRQRLHDPAPQVRQDALDRISQMRSRAAPAVPDLIALLRDPEERRRQDGDFPAYDYVGVTLGLIGPAAGDAVPAFLELLQQPDAMMRLRAVTELPKLGPRAAEAVPALTKALRDEAFAVRTGAVRALRNLDPTALKNGLKEALTDADASNRADAAERIGELGPLAASLAPALRVLLVDENPQVRRAAKAAGATTPHRALIRRSPA